MARKQELMHTQNPEKLCRHYSFAQRMHNTPKFFIREILRVTENPEIISFAGGLPNPSLIDVGGIAEALPQQFSVKTARLHSSTRRPKSTSRSVGLSQIGTKKAGS